MLLDNRTLVACPPPSSENIFLFPPPPTMYPSVSLSLSHLSSPTDWWSSVLAKQRELMLVSEVSLKIDACSASCVIVVVVVVVGVRVSQPGAQYQLQCNIIIVIMQVQQNFEESLGFHRGRHFFRIFFFFRIYTCKLFFFVLVQHI